MRLAACILGRVQWRHDHSRDETKYRSLPETHFGLNLPYPIHHQIIMSYFCSNSMAIIMAQILLHTVIKLMYTILSWSHRPQQFNQTQITLRYLPTTNSHLCHNLSNSSRAWLDRAGNKRNREKTPGLAQSIRIPSSLNSPFPYFPKDVYISFRSVV